MMAIQKLIAGLSGCSITKNGAWWSFKKCSYPRAPPITLHGAAEYCSVGKVQFMLCSLSPSSSTVLNETAQHLHFMAREYVQCHWIPSTLPICRRAQKRCEHQFSGKAGWRTEGNSNLHTPEPLQLINADYDQPKTPNIHFRHDLLKCYEGHQIVWHSGCKVN